MQLRKCLRQRALNIPIWCIIPSLFRLEQRIFAEAPGGIFTVSQVALFHTLHRYRIGDVQQDGHTRVTDVSPAG